MNTALDKSKTEKETDIQDEWVFRKPQLSDGDKVHALIQACPPLDTNSAYCNFLQVSHFSDTCVVAERNGEIVGFISAYIKPSDYNASLANQAEQDSKPTLFVWQVAVAENSRGCGLAYRMLHELLSRDCTANVTAVETTITEDNQSSWRLFQKLESEMGEKGNVSVFLDKQQHFADQHDSEMLFHIPLKARDLFADKSLLINNLIE